MKIVHQGVEGDIELDEASVGYDFDVDEYDIKKYEDSIINEPTSEFTKEGYWIDGTIVDDDASLKLQSK